MSVDRELRAIVNGIYDLQELRIAIGNRIVASFRAKLGIKPSEDKKKRGKEADKLLKALRNEYKRITDGITKITMRLKIPEGMELISSIAEVYLLKQYEEILSSEGNCFSDMSKVVETRPLWGLFFADVKGCGPVVAGFLLAYTNIEVCDTVSKFWYYCGYGVEPDGFATSRRAEHLFEVDYINKKGEPATKMSIRHNPKVKSKLAFVLARGLLTSKGYYKTEIYEPYKTRIKSMPKHADKVPAHIDTMAKRKAIKEFLKDLWAVWRQAEGFPITPPYAEAKLGLKHGDHATINPEKPTIEGK